MPFPTIKDQKHHRFGKGTSGLTPPNTPVFQHHSRPGPDIDQLEQLLVKLIQDGYPKTKIIEHLNSQTYSI